MIELTDITAGLAFRFDGKLYEALDSPKNKTVRVYRIGDGKEVELTLKEVRKGEVIGTAILLHNPIEEAFEVLSKKEIKSMVDEAVKVVKKKNKKEVAQ